MARSDPEPTDWRLRSNASGQFQPRDDNHDIARALERFRAKCRFEPRTGCVLWTGGTTRGRGNTATYGSFWYDGRRWFAHRFAAAFIHGLNIDGLTVGHCCPWTPDGHPNTLCVEHLAGETLASNIAERNTRHATARKASQASGELQLWAFVERGLEEPPPVTDPGKPNPYTGPDLAPPEWLGLTKGT